MKKVVKAIIKELDELATLINDEELTAVVETLCLARANHQHVFLAGAGRSGCVVKAFTNRLMHLGFECSLIGDITTPPIKKGDVLFILSGSGKTATLVNMAKKANDLNAVILTMTLQKDGDIAKLSKASISGTTRLQDKEYFTSIQPVGSSFEQLSFLTCDGLVMLIKEKLGLSNDDLISNHANLE